MGYLCLKHYCRADNISEISPSHLPEFYFGVCGAMLGVSLLCLGLSLSRHSYCVFTNLNIFECVNCVVRFREYLGKQLEGDKS